MNRYAYKTTGIALNFLSKVSRAKIWLHDENKIPEGSKIFVINHFTRIETLLLPYYIDHLLDGVPVWSLASSDLFKGSLGAYLNQVGAVSTKNPNRDLMIVKSLLTGEAAWIIFPEGRLVKTKKIMEKGKFMIYYDGGKHTPKSGAAALALRTEFYRRRLMELNQSCPEECGDILNNFGTDKMEPALLTTTRIIPVNITYYPIRAKENILSNLAKYFFGEVPEIALEEIMIEGSMLLQGVDIDIRFGDPIEIAPYLEHPAILKDIRSKEPIGFDDPIPSLPLMRKAAHSIMHRYMTEIYRMTTVNHDHLFASMLFELKKKRIHEDDLRRRVFYLTTYGLANLEVYHHSSLDSSQVHLLTDDRYDKMTQMVKLAMEKKLIHQEGRYLVKDMKKFVTPFDLRTIRADNPLWVIANEIEPLKHLQSRVKKIAKKSRWLMRKKVVKYLLESAMEEYEADYERHFIQGESRDKDIGAPFLIQGGNPDIGVLLIHGYLSAPLQMGKLATYLSRQGFWVYSVRLKGHGTSPADLATTGFRQWIESVDNGYAILKNTCKQVVVGGFSTGGALALELGTRAEHLLGVFAVNPPLRMQDLSKRYPNAKEVWSRLKNMVNINNGKPLFVDHSPEHYDIDYVRNPVNTVREIELLMEHLMPGLDDYTFPVMIFQSENDPVAGQKGSRRIFERIRSHDKRYVLMSFQRHGILLGEGSERVFEMIGDYIRHLSKTGSSGKAEKKQVSEPMAPQTKDSGTQEAEEENDLKQ